MNQPNDPIDTSDPVVLRRLKAGSEITTSL